MNRAYSLLTVKAVQEDQRIITGVATTPEPDRMGDIVEPLGVTFKNPMPLLHQHDSMMPVGTVKFDKPTKDGITFTAQMPVQVDSPDLQARIDMAWAEVKAGLVRAVSIGFRALEYAFIEGTNGIRFLESEVLELSLVSIPANSGALITQIKSIDTATRAASGIRDDEGRPVPPGVTGKTKTHKPVNLKPKEGKNVNIKEQIAALEKKRDESKAKMLEIQQKASDAGRTKDSSEQEEFDGLKTEVETVERELVDLKALDAMNIKTATPAPAAAATDPAAAANARTPSGSRVVEVRNHKLEKGVPFIRMVSALAMTKGNRFEAAQIADQRWKDSTPEVGAILRMPGEIIQKTAVNAGTTTDSTWAGPLAQYTNLASEFIDYLRPLTILGRIQGFRRVPFLVKVPRQTAGASVNWVGQGKVKPLTSLAFDSLTLDPAKVAGIIPLTEELVRLSSPSAEVLVRDDLAAAITQFLDSEFIDPTNASTDVSPAAVTYGVTPVTASGTTASAFRADVKSMLASLLVANLQISGGTWVMTQQQAVALSLMQTATGAPEFPGITPTGGTLLGFPVVTSENVPSMAGSPADGYYIAFILPGEILLADDGGVTIDISREASLIMDTSPDSPETASTVTINLWQHNMVAIKAERYINWKPRRTTVAGLIQGAKYAE
jgi:HK97 family phage major capsid protein/HK97 family phage prohead protease